MYYKIDLSNYEPREVPEYQEFTNYNDIKWEQIEMIDKELDNFKDSFGNPWSEWTLNNLRNRLQLVDMTFNTSVGEKVIQFSSGNVRTQPGITAVGVRVALNKVNLTIHFPFLKSLLQSFCKTSEVKYEYHFYLAYDYNDPYFSNKTSMKTFQSVYADNMLIMIMYV